MNIIEQDEDVNPLSNTEQSVDIGIYLGEDLVHEIASNTSHDGETYWTIPTNLASDLYELRIFESIDPSVSLPDGNQLTTQNTGGRLGAEISVGIGGGGSGIGNMFDGNSGDVNIGINNDFDSDGDPDFDDRFSFSGDRTFDANYYLEEYPGIAAAGVNPQRHYVEFGFKEGKDPNAIFDTSYYLEEYPGIAAAGINPLQHYFEFGFKEGKNPSASFDTNYYLEQNPDVAEDGVNAVRHYIEFGRAEGRSTNPVFASFNRSRNALLASADLTAVQFKELQDSANIVNENNDVAIALPIILYKVGEVLIYTAITLEVLKRAKNFQEAVSESEIGVLQSPFPGFSENSNSDNNTGGDSSEEVETGTKPFDLGTAKRIRPESIPNGDDFLERISDGQFVFPAEDEIGFVYFNASNAEPNWSDDYRRGEKSNDNISFDSPILEDFITERELRNTVINSVETSPGAVPNKARKRFERGGGNIGIATYTIDGKTKTIKSFSGTSNLDGFAEYIPNESRKLKATQVGNRIGDVDTEAKILEQIFRETTEKSVGTIRLFTRNPVCKSCGGVIENFVKQRKNIDIEIIEGI